MKENVSPNMEQKIWAAASYLWILSLVVLAARKDNEYIRFHANQGVLLFVVSVVSMILGPIGMLINVVVALAAIMGIVKSIQGEKWALPAAGGLAQSLGNWIAKTLKL